MFFRPLTFFDMPPKMFVFGRELRMSKTRKVAGVDCSASCFLLVPGETEPSTWKLPVHVPGDIPRTINLVKNNLVRFHEMKAIPVSQRSAIWNRLVGCAMCLGVPVQRDPVVSVTDEEIDLLLAERKQPSLWER